MVTLSEIVRWFSYRLGSLYYRLAGALMRRDKLLLGSERKFRALLESAPDAIVIIDWHGHIALVNARTEEIFGYDRRELVGDTISALIPERFRGVHRSWMKAYMRNPTPREMGSGLELHGRRKDGSEFPVEISLSPLWSNEGLLVSAAIRDVSERKRAEAEADRLKSEFFGLVSHELRTPLTSISGYIDVLVEQERERLSEPGREYLDVVKRNAERLDGLVQDLLLATQVEAGRFEIDPGVVDAEQLALDSTQRTGPAAAAAGVELRSKVGAVPPFAGDTGRLGQVIDNLLSNAIKFSRPGDEVELAIDAEGSDCVITVRDTGAGIPPEELSHLFDRFYRAPNSSREQIQGVGLGLAIVKAIVEAHGGTLDVASELGSGSTFSCRLPMDAVEELRPNRDKEVIAR